MLTEERFSAILELLQEKKAITVTELTILLNTSESTIRRDLNSLQNLGKLKKVHGGATVLEDEIFTFTKEEDVPTKASMNVKEKIEISKYAAAMIQEDDFVYIDAGTTTEHLIDYIGETKAKFLTNGIVHAKKLLQKGYTTYILGGQLKSATEAIIGSTALHNLKKYNMTKAFLGTNGIQMDRGFTTPDVEEAAMKEAVIQQSYVSFILADRTKFGKITPVSFAQLEQACIITDRLLDKKYLDYTVIKEVFA